MVRGLYLRESMLLNVEKDSPVHDIIRQMLIITTGVRMDRRSIRKLMFYWSFKDPGKISDMTLDEMKSIAEYFLGHPVQQVQVKVPPYFNDNQRQATVDAARIAGLEVLQIMNEPTDATCTQIPNHSTIYQLCPTVTFYLGHGLGDFDVSIINTDGKKCTVFHVPDIRVRQILEEKKGALLQFCYNIRRSVQNSTMNCHKNEFIQYMRKTTLEVKMLFERENPFLLFKNLEEIKNLVNGKYEVFTLSQYVYT